VLRVLLSPRWLLRHLLLVIALATCWGFGRWQLHRALDRHSILNWSYTVEWALFGGFALLCWGWFLRDELRGRDADPEAEPEPAPRGYLPVAQPVTEEEDPELAAYNRYLAELNAGTPDQNR
jgi:hypothetical protein